MNTLKNYWWKNIYFHHIGKTAGTSYLELFREIVRKSKCSKIKGPCREVIFQDTERYAFFSGHLPLVYTSLLPSPSFQFTTLRDPIELILSTYNHLYRLSGKHVAFRYRNGAALESIDDFLNDTYFRMICTNPQVHSLGRSLSQADFLLRCARIDRTEWFDWSCDFGDDLLYLLYGDTDDDRNSKELLTTATSCLIKHFTSFGIVGRETDSIGLLKETIGFSGKLRLVKTNSSGEGKFSSEDLSQRQLGILRSMTHLDRQLITAAQTIMDSRISILDGQRS